MYSNTICKFKNNLFSHSIFSIILNIFFSSELSSLWTFKSEDKMNGTQKKSKKVQHNRVYKKTVYFL